MAEHTIELTSLSHKELTSLLGIVRKEWVKRNREKYLKECFVVGDIVKFRGIRKSVYHSRLAHHPDAPVYFGYVASAHIQRTGRIQTYIISYSEGDEEHKVSRGIRQVERPTSEEERSFILVDNVRKV